MKKLLLFACLLGLFACGNQQKKSAAPEETQVTEQETEQEIPHIFHGMTKTISATSDQNKEQGYVEVNYTDDGRVLLIVDFLNTLWATSSKHICPRRRLHNA